MLSRSTIRFFQNFRHTHPKTCIGLALAGVIGFVIHTLTEPDQKNNNKIHQMNEF